MPLPLAQGRGLKLVDDPTATKGDLVAPHAGAWLGTRLLTNQIPARRVAPHAGAWIGTRCSRWGLCRSRGRPLRRGVDWNNGDAQAFNADFAGRPLRRGVDWNMTQVTSSYCILVAPHSGAWIGTAARPAAGPQQTVAPHAGAWIGTPDIRPRPPRCGSSPLTQGRGLELVPEQAAHGQQHVAPHAGAWIGTVARLSRPAFCRCRPSCRGVDWNMSPAMRSMLVKRSPLTQGRGLEPV